VLDLLAPLKGKRVPDAGCGDGTCSLEAAERGAPVTGVDLSEDLPAVARERSAARGIAVDWRQGDVLALPFPDSSFDSYKRRTSALRISSNSSIASANGRT